MLLAGPEPSLEILRSQMLSADLVERTVTGGGFYCDFLVPMGTDTLGLGVSLELDDVHAEIPSLLRGAGFTLFVRDGVVDCLEGYSFEELWPEPITSFKLSYDSWPRNIILPQRP